MKKTILSCLILISLLHSCCIQILPDRPTQMVKRDQKNKKLRMDGYYYKVLIGYICHETKEKISHIKPQVIFENGTMFNTGQSWQANKLEQYEQEYLFSKDYIIDKRKRNSWSVFNIEGDKIEIEFWWRYACERLKTSTKYGRILSDTSFVIELTKNNNSSEYWLENDTLFFKALKVKPDSTTTVFLGHTAKE